MKKSTDDEAILMRQLQPCVCGAKQKHIEKMTSIDGTEMGILCLKCERFSLGEDLEESIKNWNKRSLGD